MPRDGPDKSYLRFLETIIPGSCGYDPRAKRLNRDSLIAYMLSRTQSMFEYEGLPDTIPPRMLELYLQSNGSAGIAEVNGGLYALVGGLGGEPDPYYRPTIYTVANPALKLSRAYRIGVDCALILNDSMLQGLLPMYGRFAHMLTEAELSLNVALINTRLVDLITAGTDRAKTAVDAVLADVEEGKLASVVDKSMEGVGNIKAFPYAQTQTRTLTELLETIQYIKASWYNELGLNANFNMKRESITAGETQLNDDALFPLVDDMLSCRQEGLEKVNRMFGTHISVRLASSWEDNKIETELKQDAIADGETRDTAEESGQSEGGEDNGGGNPAGE